MATAAGAALPTARVGKQVTPAVQNEGTGDKVGLCREGCFSPNVASRKEAFGVELGKEFKRFRQRNVATGVRNLYPEEGEKTVHEAQQMKKKHH